MNFAGSEAKAWRDWRASRRMARRGCSTALVEDRRRARKAKMPKISAEYGVVSGRIAHEHPPHRPVDAL